MNGFGRTDDALRVKKISEGDELALAAVYSQYAGGMHALARVICGHVRAQEVTRDVFLELWKCPEHYSTDRGTLRSYLLMQIHKRAVDVLRADTARTASAPPVATDIAALALVEQADVDKLVKGLPHSERDVIVLAYFGGHTYCEVARLLAVPKGTVKRSIRTGLKRLRAQGMGRFELTQ